MFNSESQYSRKQTGAEHRCQTGRNCSFLALSTGQPHHQQWFTFCFSPAILNKKQENIPKEGALCRAKDYSS